MNVWLVVLHETDDEIVYKTQHFQSAVDKCNELVLEHDLDYAVWLESEYKDYINEKELL